MAKKGRLTLFTIFFINLHLQLCKVYAKFHSYGKATLQLCICHVHQDYMWFITFLNEKYDTICMKSTSTDWLCVIWKVLFFVLSSSNFSNQEPEKIGLQLIPHGIDICNDTLSINKRKFLTIEMKQSKKRTVFEIVKICCNDEEMKTISEKKTPPDQKSLD